MATPTSGRSVLERVQTAQNQHDLEAFLDCLHPDYQSEQPVHPDRAFGGREQVRKNWSAMFSSTPDLRSELLGAANDGDTWWSEWHWFGTRSDGTRLDMRGIIIAGIKDDRIIRARIYMEPIEEAGAGIDAAVESMTHKSPKAE